MNVFYFIKLLADFLTFDVFGLRKDTHAAEAVSFFVYDVVKIFILLAVIIFAVSFVRSYLPPEKIRRFLSRRSEYAGNVLASLFGIITPFCTCSAIPLFLGFVEAGVPLGVTFSFLVASPMINEVALVMLLGLFGWKIALLYVGSGLLISILSGIIIGRLSPEKLLADFVFQKKKSGFAEVVKTMTFGARVDYALGYTAKIVKKVWIFIIIGVAFGAWMHGYVPAGFLAEYAGADKWYAVPFATLLGIPLYSNAAGIIPLVSVLTEKGVSIGTTLAFMMAVTGLSLPEFMILRRIMKTKLILLFAGIVGAGIIATGYLFNLVLIQ